MQLIDVDGNIVADDVVASTYIFARAWAAPQQSSRRS